MEAKPKFMPLKDHLTGIELPCSMGRSSSTALAFQFWRIDQRGECFFALLPPAAPLPEPYLTQHGGEFVPFGQHLLGVC